MRVLLTLILLAVASATAASERFRDAGAAHLEELRRAVSQQSSVDNVDAYLRAFPKSFPEFVSELFQVPCPSNTCPIELHLKELDRLFRTHDRDVLATEIRASIGGVNIADGPNDFQLQVTRHAANQAALFAGELSKLGAAEQRSVIEFFVDWERGPTKDTLKLVEALRRLSLNALADEIELAIAVRKLRYDG